MECPRCRFEMTEKEYNWSRRDGLNNSLAGIIHIPAIYFRCKNCFHEVHRNSSHVISEARFKWH